MARVALHYFPGDSFLHRWDGRCKFLAFLVITATFLQSKITWLAFDSILMVGLFIISRFPLRRLIREFWFWGIFLLGLFLFHSFFTPGARLSSVQWLPVTRNGIRMGALISWRLGLILGYAVLFTAITRPREIQNVLNWILRPFSFLPARRIGLMVSLTIHFFAIILDQAEEVRLAHNARLGDQNRNPFRRAKFITLPLLRRSFSRAEDVTFALAARGFRDDLPLQIPKLPLSHLFPFLVFLAFLIIFYWFL